MCDDATRNTGTCGEGSVSVSREVPITILESDDQQLSVASERLLPLISESHKRVSGHQAKNVRRRGVKQVTRDLVVRDALVYRAVVLRVEVDLHRKMKHNR